MSGSRHDSAATACTHEASSVAVVRCAFLLIATCGDRNEWRDSMSEPLSLPNRRDLLVASAAAAALIVLPEGVNGADGDAIRPFRVTIPEEKLVDLRRRIAATRWPDPETVDDQSQGIQLAKLKPLVVYWATGYDWRKAEAKLNALPQLMTPDRRCSISTSSTCARGHPNALPLIMTHGWPGSVLELLRTVGPLTDPTAHGGRAEDAFDLVMPSMLGFGFSEKPTNAGWGPDRIARVWAGADEAPRLHALRRSRRRLGLARLQRDGTSGTGGPARHPHQLARGRAARGGRGDRRLAGPRLLAFPRRSARPSTYSAHPRKRAADPTLR